jgi:hypothetical protein
MNYREAAGHADVFVPHAFAEQIVDLRSQGRSTWTPGRYSLGNRRW